MLVVSPQPAAVSECEREPVHIPGAIQPFGVLLAFDLPTWTIAHVSRNAAGLFDKSSAEAMIGQSIETVFSQKIIHDLRNVFQAAMISGFSERLAAIAVGPANDLHDVQIHASGPLAIAELIPCDSADTMRSDPTSLVKTIVDRLRRTTTFQSFLTSAARQVRAVTGYDRVMIYKFLEDQSGKVVAEALRGDLPPFLNLHYPASDIPSQARALFERQWLRMIPAVDHQTIAIIPTLGVKGTPVDLSRSMLRAASPVHLQYLRNMGSAATLTLSIIVGNRLWGLIACHHETPRRVSATTCSAVELFAQVFSTQIDTKQQNDELLLVARARESHDQFIASMQPNDTIFDNLSRFDGLLRHMIVCDGIGVWADGRLETSGTTPPLGAIDALIRFLDTKPSDRVYTTNALSLELPDALPYVDQVSGLVAIPFSRTPRDYLLFFRREVVETVSWGGDPNKAVAATEGHVIGPRASFEAWKEQVYGTSIPWRRSEIMIAEALRVSLLDVILRRSTLLDQERRTAQETQLLLVAELNHRVKNVLAVIQSLVGQTRQSADTIQAFTDDLQSRIQALSIAHDHLTQSHWQAAPLSTLIEAEARAWIEAGDTRLSLSGPSLMIEARAYQTLALVLHEMTTNAAKYGALSKPNGQLDIAWELLPAGDLALVWSERGGPEVRRPTRRGFGTIIVEQSIPFELRGEAEIDYRPDGVQARFVIPANFVSPGDDMPIRPKLPPLARADLAGKNLLLVEDSMMIALDAQTMLQNCGAEVELAATASDARRAIKLNRFDAAILDVNLYTETSFVVAEDLQDLDIPFVFATGYGEMVSVPDRFRSVLIVSKPYVEDVLRAALAA